jgi:import inner membrane translocase subunit TIM17
MEGREPCPYRIVDDVGGAFCMGSIGGGIWHYFKGVRNAPKGERLRGGISSVKARAPLVGGTLAGGWGKRMLRFEGGRTHLQRYSIYENVFWGGCDK